MPKPLKKSEKKSELLLDGRSLKLQDVWQVARNLELEVKIHPKAIKQIQNSKKCVDKVLAQNSAVYGINTGFGLLSSVRIPKAKLSQLQVNLIRSHAAGVGTPLSIPEVRAMILLRANNLVAGFSGVSVELIESLLGLLNKGVHPYIPEQGSVGASGDLAPLAHLSLTLIGEGRCFYKGELTTAEKALKSAKLKPYKLKPKEGLALINGTQAMTAIGALVLEKAERLTKLSDLASAMSLEACLGSEKPFAPEISNVRPHKGQIEVARNLRNLLSGSEIMKSHHLCKRVQDPYSFRCIPQVHGACRDLIKQARKTVEIEINSVTDNPLVFAKTGKIISGGNFHGEYIAFAMDQLAIGVAELADISDQRIQKLINPHFSEGLPPFLVKDSGLNSGFMIVQYASAALVSENKVLCHPASVDSIPTSADKEDHVSMGTIAARKARNVVENTWNVIAIEMLCATQGIDFRRPLKSSTKINQAYSKIRSVVSFLEEDRVLHDDILKITCKMWEL
ncbi:MAG: histidine ammonia-lyase [Bacteriovoracia bacterium]